MGERLTCPSCGSDLTGPEIPLPSRRYFGHATHFSRRIDIVDRDRDCCVAYACPDCQHQWPRPLREIVLVVEADEVRSTAVRGEG